VSLAEEVKLPQYYDESKFKFDWEKYQYCLPNTPLILLHPMSEETYEKS